MKPMTNKILTGLTLTALILATAGCTNAQFTSSATANSASPSTGSGGGIVGGGGTIGTGGSTGTGGTTTTTPPAAACTASTVQLSNGDTTTINLQQNSDGSYFGEVLINGGYSFFANPGQNVTIDSLNNNGQMTARYNTWLNGHQFSGFYQDSGFGAIVLTVTSVSNNCATGAIYLQQFAQTGAPVSPYRQCWDITIGPYDCQDQGIMSKTTLTPGGGYFLLGTYSGLGVSQSFQ